jgi:hypothetical protein
MSFRVVALSGPAGCGKDTAARFLGSRYGFALSMFAGPLKAGLCAMFGWLPESLDNREWKEAVLPDIGKSPRQLMQTLGTEWGRQMVHPDLWLLLAAQRIEQARRAGLPGIVFTDCRFVNEAWVARRNEGLVIQIVRPGCDPVAAHVSEAGIPPHLVDAVVRNEGTLDELYVQLVEVVGPVPSGTAFERCQFSVDKGAYMCEKPKGHEGPCGSNAAERDEALQRCGHMSRTKRVCTEAAGHRLRHNDGIALWDMGE